MRAAANEAKARIGEAAAPPEDAFSAAAFGDHPYEPEQPHDPRPAVDFDLPEPEAAFDAPRPDLGGAPDQSIAFDDFGGSVDDDGIPVWEDPP